MAEKIAAFGTKLYKGTTSGVLYASVVSISGPALSADVIDVTSHASTNAWEESVIGILRPGDIGMDIIYDPATATHKNASGGLLFDFLARVSITLTLEFTDSATTEWTFSAFVTGFVPSMPVAGELGAAVTFKPTGDMTLV